MKHPENWTNKSRIERNAAVVQRLLDAGETDKALEIARERGECVWVADDGNCPITYDNVDDRDEAAEEYVSSGDWGERNKTSWVTVYTHPKYVIGKVKIEDRDDYQSHKITIKAEEPECSELEHEWFSPYSILGGIKENPGVWGNAGGAIIHELCKHCGCLKIVDTWAQDRETGEQGLTSVEYQELGDHKYSEEYSEWKESD